MLMVENMLTWGFEHAIRGMRNPMNSWDKSDSHFHYHSCLDCDHQPQNCENDHKIFADCVCFNIGENDLDLMQRLYKAGTEHGKYLRQIFVSMDITAPLYWWKVFDTYKVGTVANSCSTMHKIQSRLLNEDDFQDGYIDKDYLRKLNRKISEGKDLKDKVSNLRDIKKMLPEGFLQKATMLFNYETLIAIYFDRRNHRLKEWQEICSWIESLPYMKEFLGVLDA